MDVAGPRRAMVGTEGSAQRRILPSRQIESKGRGRGFGRERVANAVEIRERNV